MVNKIKVVLERDGPGLSSDITQIVMSEFGLGYDAARKQVSRGFEGMKKLAYLNFPKNVKFVYLERDYGSPKYWRALEAALSSVSSCYSLAYWAVKCRDGIVPVGHFVSVCGSPAKQQKHVAAEKVLENLVLSKVLVQRSIPSLGDCLVLGYLCKNNRVADYQEAIASVYSRLLAEDKIILPAMKSWLRNAGLVSFNTVSLRGMESSPVVSTFQWDLTAPSYLKVFSNWNSSKNELNPGFLTCDVLLKDVDADGIKPFLRKYETLSNLKTRTTFFHILLVTKYTEEALKAAKSSGLVLVGTTENFFGKKIADGLKLLIDATKESQKAQINKETYLELIKIFDQFQGVYGNLKGTLFEMFCTQVVRERYRPKELITNLIIRNNLSEGVKVVTSGDAEIDIYMNVDGFEHVFIECKGFMPSTTISHSSVEEWIKKRIPRSMVWLRNNNKLQGSTVKFELWITCNLSDESVNLITSAQAKMPNQIISIMRLGDISEEVKRTRNKELKKIFDGVFRKDPLSKVKKKLSDFEKG